MKTTRIRDFRDILLSRLIIFIIALVFTFNLFYRCLSARFFFYYQVYFHVQLFFIVSFSFFFLSLDVEILFIQHTLKLFKMRKRDSRRGC
jgi:hypothetical protein